MMLRKFTHLIVFVLLVVSCTEKKWKTNFNKSEKVNATPSLQKLDSFTIQQPDSLTFGNFREVFQTNAANSRFAFYDKVTKHMVITNTQGKVLSVWGGKGRGPKELMQVFAYNFDEHGNLVVYDNRLLRLKIYSPEGQMVNNVRLEEERKGHFIGAHQLYAQNDKIYVGILEAEFVNISEETAWWNSQLLAVYNYDGDLLSRMANYDPSHAERKYYRYTPVFYVDSQAGRFFSTHSYNFRIQKWDIASGKRMAYFGHKPQAFKAYDQSNIDGPLPKKERLELFARQSVITELYTDQDYIYLLYQNIPESFFDTKNNMLKEYNVALYERYTHRYVGDITLPGPLANISDSKIYVVENNNPANYQIGVYEVDG